MFKQYLSPTSVAFFDTNVDDDDEIVSLSTNRINTKTAIESTRNNESTITRDTDDDAADEGSKHRNLARRLSVSSLPDLRTKITASLIVTSDENDDEYVISPSGDDDQTTSEVVCDETEVNDTFSSSNEIHSLRQPVSSLPDVLSSLSMCTNTTINTPLTNHLSSPMNEIIGDASEGMNECDLNDEPMTAKEKDDIDDFETNRNERLQYQRLQYHQTLLYTSCSVSTISTRSLSSASSSLSTSSRTLTSASSNEAHLLITPSSSSSSILSIAKSPQLSSFSENPNSTITTATSHTMKIDTNTTSSAIHPHNHQHSYNSNDNQNQDTLHYRSNNTNTKNGILLNVCTSTNEEMPATLVPPTEASAQSSDPNRRKKSITMKVHFNETVIVHTYKLQVQYYKETTKTLLYYSKYEYEQMEINAYRDLVQYQSSKRLKKQQQQQYPNTEGTVSSSIVSSSTTSYCYRGLESFYGTKNYKLCKLRRKGLMDEILQEQYNQYNTNWDNYDELAFYNCSIAITKYDQMIAYQRGLYDEYIANKIYGRYLSSLHRKQVISTNSKVQSIEKQQSQPQQKEQEQVQLQDRTLTNPKKSSILPILFRTKQKTTKDSDNNGEHQSNWLRRHDAPTYSNGSLLSSRRSRRNSTTASDDPDGNSLTDLMSCVSAPTLFRSSLRSSTSSANRSRGLSSTTTGPTTTGKEKPLRRFWPKSFSVGLFRTTVKDIVPSSQLSILPDHETI